jgi:di/tricarboxylate transporter
VPLREGDALGLDAVLTLVVLAAAIGLFVTEKLPVDVVAMIVLVALVGGFGPVAVLAAVYLRTALLTEAMSNSASAVPMTPVAVAAAVGVDADPVPFAVAVAFAASTSFATPVRYQTNTIVYSAGGYRFADFLRFGLPLNLLFLIVAVLFIPRFWPLTGRTRPSWRTVAAGAQPAAAFRARAAAADAAWCPESCRPRCPA